MRAVEHEHEHEHGSAVAFTPTSWAISRRDRVSACYQGAYDRPANIGS
jgi:hypothetical protein